MKAQRRLAIIVLLCLQLGGSAVVAQQSADRFYLKRGDRVVFYGDSITDQRLYTTFVETYVVTRFPSLQVDFIHSGWGGDRVTGGGGGPIEKRLQRDVIAYRPTVVTIMLGMNDGSYKAFDDAVYRTYTTGYENIIKQLKQSVPGVRLTLIEPSPYDDVTRAPTFDGGYNAVLVRYGEFIKDLATREKVDVADLNTSVVASLQKAKATDADTAQKIVPDRVHPEPGGHLLMAEALLKAWNAPALVSSVALDATKKTTARAENAKVTDIKGDAATTLAWTQEDAALPFPFDMKDAPLALAVRSSDVVESLDQQMLKVAGLTAANYMLRIDGADIASFTKEQLATGINLATMRTTPMFKQAMAVHDLTIKHNNVHFARWRTVQVPLETMTMTAQIQDALKSLDALESDLVAQQRRAARTLPHRFELVAQTVKSS